MDPEEIKKDLKYNKKDLGANLTNASVSLIPILGGPLSILLGSILPSVNDRQNKWLIQIAKDIKFLTDRNENFLENLVKDENFITILMQASQIAIHNHQDEKLEALRNAVLNSALNISIEEDMQLMFLNFVNSFTNTHLKILLVIYDPHKYVKKFGSDGYHDLDSYIAHVLPELVGHWGFYRFIYEDLFKQNLLIKNQNGYRTDEKNFPPMLTHLGRDFLSFITQPNGFPPSEFPKWITDY